MSTDETYNGYANRETWAFMLNVTNDHGLDESARAYVVTAAAPGRSAICLDDSEDAATYARMAATDALRDWAEMHFTRDGYTEDTGGSWPDDLADIASDIGSLWRVNWAECVDALINE